MPIPSDYDVFSWSRVQAGRLATGTERLKIFYSEWANLTAGQKTSLKAQAVSGLDLVTSELADIRAAINSL